MAAERELLCYGWRTGDRWEALCVDLDIAVEGASEFETRMALREAIRSYIEAAMAEAPEQRALLLARRAPFRVRLGLWASLQLYLIKRRSEEHGSQSVFGEPCRA